MTCKWKNIFSIIRSDRGSVLPLVGVALFVMVGATGIAIDMGRQEIVQSRMQNALDSAGLAAGTTIGNTPLNTVVSNYFYANFPATQLGVTINSLTVTTANNNSVFNLAVNGTVNTTFMNIFGIHTMNVGAVTQVTKQSRGMELVLVMDNTGSMSDPAGGNVSKIQASKTAAATLLGILYGTNNTIPNLWIGVVPFSQAVNIGTNYTSWLNQSVFSLRDYGPIADTVHLKCTPYVSGAGVTTNAVYYNGPMCQYVFSSVGMSTNFAQLNWQGCVESRSNGTSTPAYDITDDPPSVKLFNPYFWVADNVNPWRAGNNTQTCTGGQCTASHTVNTTCPQSYPPCCSPGAEGCINQPNCGLPPTTYACTQTICDQHAPQTCTITGSVSSYDYEMGRWLGYNMGPNAACPQQPIQPMVAEENTVLAAINNMQPVGDTEIDLGMAWAWRMLSPRWQGLWGGEMNANGLPLAYHTKLMTKAVVLMTDGDNNLAANYYSAYGYPNQAPYLLGSNACSGTDCTTGIHTLNTRTSNGSNGVCDMMKQQGIIIYAVALGTDVSAAGQALLQQCATDPSHFFLSPTTNDLQAVFQQIGNSLANLYVSH